MDEFHSVDAWIATCSQVRCLSVTVRGFLSCLLSRAEPFPVFNFHLQLCVAYSEMLNKLLSWSKNQGISYISFSCSHLASASVCWGIHRSGNLPLEDTAAVKEQSALEMMRRTAWAALCGMEREPACIGTHHFVGQCIKSEAVFT